MSVKSSLQRYAQKALGLSDVVRAWLAGEPLPSGGDRPTQPYSQVETVFTCVSKLIDGIQGLVPVMSTASEDIVEAGPAYDLLFNNPAMSWEDFVRDVIGHYVLTRDVFLIFEKAKNLTPTKISIVSGLQMRAVKTPSGELIHWEFMGSGGRMRIFLPSDVWQWKNFNPYDPFHGIGPATASRISIEYSYAAGLFNSSALQNGADPGIIFKTPPGSKFDDEEIRMFLARFDSRHAGAGKAKKSALLQGGVEPMTLARTMVDMQMAELTKMSDSKICACFGIPPELIGLETQAQYSGGPALKDFTFNTLLPLAALFAGNINAGIINRFFGAQSSYKTTRSAASSVYFGGELRRNTFWRSSAVKARSAGQKVWLWFDASGHPAVQAAMEERADKGQKWIQSGVPLNAVTNAYDLPFEHVEWGDDWWVNAGMMPARMIMEEGPWAVTGPSAPEGGEPAEPAPQKNLGDSNSEKDAAARRLRAWTAWTATWQPIEKAYLAALRLFFVKQEKLLIARLKEAMKSIDRAKASADDIVARIVFDLVTEDGKLRVINRTCFDKASRLGIEQSAAEAALAPEAVKPAVEAARASQVLKSRAAFSQAKIAGVNKETLSVVRRHLTEGIEQGNSIDDLARTITRDLSGNRARALRIARTQTAGAVSAGRQAGMTAAGVDLKAWLTSNDDNVRPEHKLAGEKYAKGIPVGEAFAVGPDKLLFPGDPAGSAAMIINCRCMAIAIFSRGKSLSMPEIFMQAKEVL